MISARAADPREIEPFTAPFTQQEAANKLEHHKGIATESESIVIFVSHLILGGHCKSITRHYLAKRQGHKRRRIEGWY